MSASAHRTASQPGTTAPQDQCQKYAFTVAGHSRRNKAATLYPGLNYKALADFLCRPYRRAPSLSRQPTELDGAAHVFATLHRYSNETQARIMEFGSDAMSAAQFVELESGVEAGEVLFLAGWASPEWLNALGSRYRIDPEYYRRHLGSALSPRIIDLPSLPSTSKNIVQIPLITIGARSDTALLRRSELKAKRWKADVEVRKYLREMDRSAKVGTSIVRRLQLIDETYYAYEQEATISVQRKDGSWTAVCWLDCGRDLKSTGFGPWMQTAGEFNVSQNTCLPVYQFYPKVALDSSSNKHHPDHLDPSDSYQSISSLPKFYSKTLNPDVVRFDAFYALSEVISFAASSTSQYLNVIESTIDRHVDLRGGDDDTQHVLADLQHAKSILDLHLKRLLATLLFIKARGGPKWPRASSPEHQKFASDVAQNLQEDFEHLVTRTQMLSTRCSDETRLLINRSMVDEAQRSLLQAKAVAKLTWLAFFFIPFSFTTSFFGMNVVELVGSDGPRISVWTWFVVSIPVFLIAIGTSRWMEIRDLVRNWWARRTQRKDVIA